MYVPTRFEVDDLPTLHEFMARYSFALLVTVADGAPFVTHLPVLIDRDRGPYGTILGHVALANPHATMEDASNGLVIFHGPHGYVSPGWYRTQGNHVPTWNYTAVHAYGRVSVIRAPSWMESFLQRLTATHESRIGNRWRFEVSEAYRNIMRGIVGFELTIEKLEGKFKLSQNRQRADRDGVVAGLEAAGDCMSEGLAAFMSRFEAD